MEEKLEGRITFVQYEKKFVTIEYEHNGKLKSINGSIKDVAQQKLVDEKKIKKFHHFRENDAVTFNLARSVRGDKMVAENIMFRYNNSLSNLLSKAKIENAFLGYLKQVDDEFFIKEVDSYHFFPLRLSPFEMKPGTGTLNEQIRFTLNNISNPDKVTGSLLYRQFIPAYKKAQLWWEKKEVVPAKVVRVTPHTTYVEVATGMELKLPKDEEVKYEIGQEVNVRVTYVSPEKIVIERA